MKRSDFYYDLPERTHCTNTALQRDASRLMVLDRTDGHISHQHFYDLPEYLHPGDCLVINESRVIPARLIGVSEKTGSPVEVLLLTQRGDEWGSVLHDPAGVLGKAHASAFGDELTAQVLRVTETGNRIIRFDYEGIFLEVLERLGRMPLPPYTSRRNLTTLPVIKRSIPENPGSAAAPTAGFHFTPELLAKLEGMGVRIARITLHVGLGTSARSKRKKLQSTSCIPNIMKCLAKPPPPSTTHVPQADASSALAQLRRAPWNPWRTKMA